MAQICISPPELLQVNLLQFSFPLWPYEGLVPPNKRGSKTLTSVHGAISIIFGCEPKPEYALRHTGKKNTGRLETRMSGVEEWTLWNGCDVQRCLLLHINIQQKALILEEALNNQVDKTIQPAFAFS